MTLMTGGPDSWTNPPPSTSTLAQQAFGQPTATPQRRQWQWGSGTGGQVAMPYQTSAINPTADLRSQQITQQQDPQTTNWTNQAAQRVAGSGQFTPYQWQNTNDQYTQGANAWLGQAGSVYPGYQQQLGQAAQQVQGTGFGAGANAQVNPTITNQLAQQAFQNWSGGGGGVGYGGDTQNLRGQVLSGVSGLNSSPNRQQLASDAFKLLQEQSQPQYEQDLRGVGQKAAALGRIGSGMTTSDLGDVAQRRNEYFGQQARGLAGDAASQQLQDQLNRLSATQGAYGQLAGQDVTAAQVGQQGQALGLQGQQFASNLANQAFGQQSANRDYAFGLDNAQNALAFNRAGLTQSLANQGLQGGNYLSGLAGQTFGMGQGLRGENLAQQGLRNQFQTGQYGANLQGLNALGGLEGQRFGQNQQLTQDVRGERGYQNDLANQAFQQQLLQQQLQDQFLNSAYGRQGQQLGWLGQGFQGNPTGVLGQQGQQYGQQGQQTQQGVQDLIYQYLLGKGTQQPVVKAPTPPTYDPTRGEGS
jgi:hypothetical protein